MSENAMITNADLIFDDFGGMNGRNFRLVIGLKTVYGGVNVTVNPLRLPQLLEQLGLERFSELKGTYVQIMDTKFGEECGGIKSILAGSDEDWFYTDNGVYFGCEFLEGFEGGVNSGK